MLAHRRAPLFACMLAGVSLLVSCHRHSPPAPTELRVQAKLVASSQPKTLRDIAPYDDALVWNEYQVQSVLSGPPPGGKTIRVAQWCVRHGHDLPIKSAPGQSVTLVLRKFDDLPELKSVAASDDLSLESEASRYCEYYPDTSGRPLTEGERYDYGGTFSDQMKLYWRLRPQLRLAVIGSSRAAMGIAPSQLLGERNRTEPEALNLAPAGSYTAEQCLLVRRYLMDLPNLQWVLWEVSGRSFNACSRGDTRKLDDFTHSPGYTYDQEHRHELWPVKTGEPPVSAASLEAAHLGECDAWGWSFRGKSHFPEDPVAARPDLLHELSDPRYRFDDEAWVEFTETVRLLAASGRKVLLLTAPLHPITQETPAIDATGVTEAGEKALTQKLETFCAATPGTSFRDFYHTCRSQFVHRDFRDSGHLTREGAAKFSDLIAAWMAESRGP